MEPNISQSERAQSRATREQGVEVCGAGGQGQRLECEELNAGWHADDGGIISIAIKVEHDGGGAVEAKQFNYEATVDLARRDGQ
jgi:hypothetical protein